MKKLLSLLGSSPSEEDLKIESKTENKKTENGPRYSVPNEIMTKIFIEREHSWKNVEKICLEGLKSEPKNSVYLSFYGESLMNQNKEVEGKKILQDLSTELEKDLEDSENLYIYARCCDLLGFGDSFIHHKKSAEMGNIYSLSDLGYDYEKGIGTTVDKNKAFECYIKAADAGNVYAQCNLGICYEFETGTARDWVKAVKYYEMASNQGYQKGHCNLGVCYWNGTGVEKDILKSTELFEKSKDLGFDLGIKNYKFAINSKDLPQLGYKYLNSKDFEKSLKVFRRLDSNEARDIVEFITTIRLKLFLLNEKGMDIGFHFR